VPKSSEDGRPTVCDVVARNSRDPVHHLIHSRNDLLQEIRFFADYFVRDYYVREIQNAPQSVQKDRWYLIVRVLHLQELNGQVLSLLLHGTTVASTDLKRNLGDTEDSL